MSRMVTLPLLLKSLITRHGIRKICKARERGESSRPMMSCYEYLSHVNSYYPNPNPIDLGRTTQNRYLTYRNAFDKTQKGG